MKNKILKHWSIIFSSALSFLGILVGSFACAYGPPGGEEGQYELNNLKDEVEELQHKLSVKESEKSKIRKDIAKYEEQIKLLQREKDSLLILIDKFDK